jgi:hypothetical protein
MNDDNNIMFAIAILHVKHYKRYFSFVDIIKQTGIYVELLGIMFSKAVIAL